VLLYTFFQHCFVYLYAVNHQNTFISCCHSYDSKTRRPFSYFRGRPTVRSYADFADHVAISAPSNTSQITLHRLYRHGKYRQPTPAKLARMIVTPIYYYYYCYLLLFNVVAAEARWWHRHLVNGVRTVRHQIAFKQKVVQDSGCSE